MFHYKPEQSEVGSVRAVFLLYQKSILGWYQQEHWLFLIITHLNEILQKSQLWLELELWYNMEYLTLNPGDMLQTVSLLLEKKICFSFSGIYVGKQLTSLILRYLWPLEINVVTIRLNFAPYGHHQRLRYLKNSYNKLENSPTEHPENIL